MDLSPSRGSSRAAVLPPEVWAVVALLCGAGLSTGVPAFRAIPDAFDLIKEAGLWNSFGLLVLVLLAELALVSLACFVLALQLSKGDVVARVVALAVAGSLAFGLVVGDGLGDTEGKVTLACCLAAMVCLAAPARARAFFAERRRQGSAPPTVVAAEAVVVLVSAILLGVGVAYLPLSSEETKYLLSGLGLTGIALACFRTRRRLQTGDPGARGLVSGLMAGYVAAIVVGSEGALTGPLFVPLGLAVSVVSVLWLPHESQAFFGGEPTMAGLAAAGPDEFDAPAVRPTRRARDYLPPDGSPPPEPRSPSRSRYGPPPRPSPSYDEAVFAVSPPALPDDTPPPPPSSSRRTRPSSSPSPDRPPSPGFSAPASPGAAIPSATPGPPLAAPARPASATVPPPWLLEAPPDGFWPPERRRADPRRYEVVDLTSASPGEMAVALTLGIRFDTTSWFPAVDAREQIRGRYLVSMVMFDQTPDVTAFRGTSTLLVTSTRLLGVCPRGESGTGTIDAAQGQVAVWRILLDQVDWVRAEGSVDGGHLILKGWDSVQPWALLAKARVADGGGFRPAPLADLADLVNRAKHSTA